MTRIAIVTPILPAPDDVSRGRFVYEKARSLARIADVKVYLQTPRYPAIFGSARMRPVAAPSDAQRRLWEGLDVEGYTYPALPWASRAVNGRVAAARLLPRLRSFGPDAVLAYWAYPEGYAGVRAAHALGKPCVVGVMGSDVLTRRGILERLTGTALRRADAVAVVSEHLHQAVCKRYGVTPQKAQTIVNGYNTSVFRCQTRGDCRNLLGLAADAEMILYVGRLIEPKGLRELLQAFQGLAATRPRLHLALVGDGAMREELVAISQAGAAASRIHLPGSVPPEEVARWLGACDLLCLPSWSEGYPNVVVEALACGRPVVASDVGGVPEIVHQNNGILVPARKPDALAKALDEALARRWDNEAIAASMCRTWDDVARETLDLCQSAIRNFAR